MKNFSWKVDFKISILGFFDSYYALFLTRFYDHSLSKKKSFNEYKIVSLGLFELILMFYASKNIIYILDEEMK